MTAIVKTRTSLRQLAAELLEVVTGFLARAGKAGDESSTGFSWPRGL